MVARFCSPSMGLPNHDLGTMVCFFICLNYIFSFLKLNFTNVWLIINHSVFSSKRKLGWCPHSRRRLPSEAVFIGRKCVGKPKPKGDAVWAKVVQITGSDKEIQGTEKCVETKTKICAELCHQGIGLTYSSCATTKYIGMWFEYAGESADNSTIIFHRKAGSKRWKLTILTGKPTDVEEVCEKVYLKETKSHREKNT